VNVDQLIESKIQEAIAAGEFDDLPGAGKPLPVVEGEQYAGDLWLGFKVLRQGGLLPEWLSLARDIEVAETRLRELDERHASVVALAAQTGDWPACASPIQHYRHAFEAAARALRSKQDRFNISAPGPRTQRPAIWVEHHLERLDRRAAAAMGPPEAPQASV
jgi:DnaJ family protein C protein 28